MAHEFECRNIDRAIFDLYTAILLIIKEQDLH